MGLPDRVNNPYNSDLEPTLTVDATVEIQPAEEAYMVRTVELLPQVSTAEFTVPANGFLEEQEIDEFYGQDGVLVELRIPTPVDGSDAIPDGIELEVDQGGQESPRFNIKNQKGVITNATPKFGEAFQQTQLYQWEDEDLFFTFENSTGSDVTFEIVATGYAYDLRPANINPEDADVTVLTERRSLRGI